MSMHNDPALWEMFRAEVDTHMAALNDGLLTLERDPSQSGHFDSLMRAAHSIKGAAKIVGIPTAVAVSHALEDCFVSARDGRLRMSSRLVDLLFEGVDLLGRLAQDDSATTALAEALKVRAITDRIASATRLGMLEDESSVATAVSIPHASAAARSSNTFRPQRAFDAAWVTTQHREVAIALRSAPAEICFDLSDVESVDPLGLALLSLVNRCCATNGTSDKNAITLTGVKPQLAGLLQATGLDRVCTIVAAEG